MLTISSERSARNAQARPYCARTQSSSPFFETTPTCAAIDWITASIGMTSSVSHPSSYVVLEPTTASVATVVGSLSDAPATIPAPKTCPLCGAARRPCTIAFRPLRLTGTA